MIGIDTNILVRLLVKDDLGQMEEARRFTDERCTAESPGFINCVVLAELVWVLVSVYRFGRAEVADAVESILTGADRIIEHHAAVQRALDDFRETSVHFTDAMIARINLARGCEATATFDRKAGKRSGFVQIS